MRLWFLGIFSGFPGVFEASGVFLGHVQVFLDHVMLILVFWDLRVLLGFPHVFEASGVFFGLLRSSYIV